VADPELVGGLSVFQATDALVPKISMKRRFLRPTETWLTVSEPLSSPPLERSSRRSLQS